MYIVTIGYSLLASPRAVVMCFCTFCILLVASAVHHGAAMLRCALLTYGCRQWCLPHRSDQ